MQCPYCLARPLALEHYEQCKASEQKRAKWHALLDLAMDVTPEGDFFLPQFVREVMRDMQDAPKTTNWRPYNEGIQTTC